MAKIKSASCDFNLSLVIIRLIFDGSGVWDHEITYKFIQFAVCYSFVQLICNTKDSWSFFEIISWLTDKPVSLQDRQSL